MTARLDREHRVCFNGGVQAEGPLGKETAMTKCTQCGREFSQPEGLPAPTEFCSDGCLEAYDRGSPACSFCGWGVCDIPEHQERNRK